MATAALSPAEELLAAIELLEPERWKRADRETLAAPYFRTTPIPGPY